MILWERQEDGGWQGFSGELLVATVTKDELPKGAVALVNHGAEASQGLAQGSRTPHLMDRRSTSCRGILAKWLEQAALRADVMQLASRSLVKERKARPRKQAES